jgi:CRISPR-associated endoribonuclease Cas6
MLSLLVLCEKEFEGSLPAAEGYKLFAALSKRFRARGDDTLFPHAESGLQAVSLSGMLPLGSASSEGAFPTALPDAVTLFHEKSREHLGQWCVFRVSFLSDELGRLFFSLLGDAPLTLGKECPFGIRDIIGPGKHELCAHATPEALAAKPLGTLVRLHFLSPTGFNRDGMQISFPLPELVFKSLLARWRRWIAPDAWPGLEETFSSIRVERFALESRAVPLKQGSVYRGCRGYADYDFSLCGDAKTPLGILASFALFAGVGYKTAQGMGQVYPELLRAE